MYTVRDLCNKRKWERNKGFGKNWFWKWGMRDREKGWYNEEEEEGDGGVYTGA